MTKDLTFRNSLNPVLLDTLLFFKAYPPFDDLLDVELLPFLDNIPLVFYKKGDFLFQQGEQNKGCVFILKKGGISLLDHLRLIDSCDEGDIFGVRSALSGNSYLLSANVLENSLVYELPLASFRSLLELFPSLKNFFLKGLSSGLPIISSERPVELENRSFGLGKINDQSIITVDKPLIFCDPSDTILSVAIKMSTEKVGSIIVVNDHMHPIGVVTDSDFRKKVIVNQIDFNSPISLIMSKPVVCTALNPTITEVLIKFIQGSFHHLCVTKNGKNNSPALGMISNHDILIERGDHPGMIISEIKNSKDSTKVAMLRRQFQFTIFDLLQQQVSTRYLTMVTTAVNDQLIKKAIELSQEKLATVISVENFCWLSLGSEGRHEQLLFTDIDNALIFRHNKDQNIEEVRQIYLAFAREVINIQISCGFIECPAEMMASNPKWCLSLDEWKEKFSNWIKNPIEESLMHGQIFFDYRNVRGSKKMVVELTKHIFEAIDQSSVFLNFLALNTLKTASPLSFFKTFIVEKDGAYKNQFDLKKRALIPFIDSARLLMLYYKIPNKNSTIERFESLKNFDNQNKDLWESCIEATSFLIHLRALSGLKNNDSGRFIDIKALSKIQKQTLRSIFSTIDQLHLHVKNKFQTDYFRV